MAEAVDLAEMREHKPAASAAPADHQRSSARNLASPFSKVDEQITDAIILLNRLPNTIERHAREESSRSAQWVERSGRWVREHESELMKRVDRLAMFIGMRIDPKDDAMLRALLQPFEVPEYILNGAEVWQTGVSFQSGHEPPKRRVPARQEVGVQQPGFKRKRAHFFDADAGRPEYGSSLQNDVEGRQVAVPKRRRQNPTEDDEQSPFMNYQSPARPAFGSRLRPEDTFEAGMRNDGSQIQSGLASARPSYGSQPRSWGNFETGVPDFGSRVHSAPATLGSRARSEVILEDADNVPAYESRLQSGLAGAEPAPYPERRQHYVFDDGTRPSFQSDPTGSRPMPENIYEGGVPGYASRVQDEFSFTRQGFGIEPRQQIPTINKRTIGEMVGPKRKAQPPPSQKNSKQGTTGAIKIAPIAKSDEKWKKKYTIDNCPVIVANGDGFLELRCDRCHCNASGVTGKFWLGGRGIQGHLRKIHKETVTPAETLARCSIRSVSADEVRRIESGELVIEKLFYKTAKGDVQDEAEGEEAEEAEDEEEARPVKTRKKHGPPRDFSLGKMRGTTW